MSRARAPPRQRSCAALTHGSSPHRPVPSCRFSAAEHGYAIRTFTASGTTSIAALRIGIQSLSGPFSTSRHLPSHSGVPLPHPHTRRDRFGNSGAMPWDDWRKDFNKKLDNFGEDAKSKIRQQREANAGSASGGKVGLQDRMSMLKGDDPRWKRDVDSRASTAAATEHSSTVVPERNRVPPAPASSLSRARPPPPPSRHSGLATAAPAPSLPPRMQNEDGTSHPPPPYPPAQHAYPTTEGEGYIEFSRFTQDDKDAFFALLDEVSSIRGTLDTSVHQPLQPTDILTPFNLLLIRPHSSTLINGNGACAEAYVHTIHPYRPVDSLCNVRYPHQLPCPASTSACGLCDCAWTNGHTEHYASFAGS